MNLTKAALSNPAAALVAVVLLLLLGSVSLSQLPVQLFPNIDDPIITVQADWRAASPREVEAELIEPIEEVLDMYDKWFNFAYGYVGPIEIQLLPR